MAMDADAMKELQEADADQIASWLQEFLSENTPEWIAGVEPVADSTSLQFWTADGRRWLLRTEEP